HSSYVRAHARAAIRIGFEPHIFCASSRSGVVDTDFGVVHRIQSPYRYFLRSASAGGFRVSTVPLHEANLASALHQFLRGRGGRQLIHGFGVWSSAARRARWRLLSVGIESVIFASVYTLLEHEHRGKIRGYGPEHRLSQRLFGRAEQLWINSIATPIENRAYRGADLVLFNYESVRVMLEARFGPSLRTRRMPYTSETALVTQERRDNRQPAAIANLEPRDAPLVVAVSRHDPRKGISHLLRALARLKGEGVAFRACLVGMGRLLEAHRLLAARLNLGPETVITGFVEDPGEYLQHADIFVLPSLEEGSGSVSAIEAMQAGLPIVTTSVDGMPEDIKDGRNGLLVRAGDSDALAHALARLIQDSTLRRRLAQGSREAFLEQFSAERFTAAIAELYAEFGFLP
ncbi:MAG: glycosyltransferase family 4 protein, partial [Acidobacteriota bacterium]